MFLNLWLQKLQQANPTVNACYNLNVPMLTYMALWQGARLSYRSLVRVAILPDNIALQGAQGKCCRIFGRCVAGSITTIYHKRLRLEGAKANVTSMIFQNSGGLSIIKRAATGLCWCNTLGAACLLLSHHWRTKRHFVASPASMWHEQELGPW